MTLILGITDLHRVLYDIDSVCLGAKISSIDNMCFRVQMGQLGHFGVVRKMGGADGSDRQHWEKRGGKKRQAETALGRVETRVFGTHWLLLSTKDAYFCTLEVK